MEKNKEKTTPLKYREVTVQEDKMLAEEMKSFFKKRVDGYDNHMLNNVSGCKEGYKLISEYVPNSTQKLLDLGCGTGLQLEHILQKNPCIQVTGVDLSADMLSKLKEKFTQYQVQTIEGDYFKVPFGECLYETAISFQSLHHFTHDEKKKLYRKLFEALREDGTYLECDYMVEDQEIEDFHFEQLRRIRENQGVHDNEYIHYDTPCTMKNQVRLLREAGFQEVEILWRAENTTLIRAKKTSSI